MLAMQEVDVGLRRSGRMDEAVLAADATGLDAAFGPARRVGWRGRYGNVLLARNGLRDVQRVRMPRPRAGERRAAIVARTSIDGVSVAVAATHLAVEAEEARYQLTVVLDALCRRPSPHVLLGDLNLGPDVVEPLVSAAGLTLAPGPPTFAATGPRLRIDHVAVAGLSIESVQAPESDVSDHRPLVVELSPLT